jgi:2-keto-4-pentenoate hydratase
VEAEVAFKMRTTLGGPGVTAASALPAVEGALAALELPDFMFSGRPRAVDFVANSVIANAIVLGTALTPLQGLDLAAEEVVCEDNGKIVGTYTAAGVMGNPLNALAWLANHLAGRGLLLKAGDIVMAGAISILRPKAGDTVRASFAHLGSVGITVVP